MQKSNEYRVNFVCPHCGDISEINEEEWCLVGNRVNSLEIHGWGEDDEGVITNIDDAEIIGYGLPEITQSNISPELHWVCVGCGEEIDKSIKFPRDLADWLFKRNMLVQEKEE